MDVWLEDNKIVVPVIGTRFGIRKVKSGKNEDLQIVCGKESNTYVVLFDEGDVDFEITINNKNNGRGMRYTVVINRDKAIFYPKPHMNHFLQTMQSNGRKFHFLSQETEEGKKMVKAIATEYNIPYDEAAVVASQIRFTVEIEEIKSKTYMSQFNARNRYCRGLNTKEEKSDKTDTDNGMAGGSGSGGPKVEYRARGVICFSEKADQIFEPRFEIFVKDKQLSINPFVLELRMRAE